MGTFTSPGPLAIHIGVGEGAAVGLGVGEGCWVGVGEVVFTGISVEVADRVGTAVGSTVTAVSAAQPARRSPMMIHKRRASVLRAKSDRWSILSLE